MDKHPSNRGKIAVNRHQTQSKTSADNQERAIEKKTRQKSKKLTVADLLPCGHAECGRSYIHTGDVGCTKE